MKNKKIRKSVAAVLASACALCSGVMLTSCTTSHPEVKMKLSFNGESYVVEYELYRKIAPATVEHFLDLVEAEYYDGLCVHNYTETKWYAGGYTYDEEKTELGGLTAKNYFESVSSLKLTQSVWKDEEKTDPTYTLYGEFSSNGFKVKAGALQQSFGSLTMYYTDKSDVVRKVYAKRSDGKGADMKDYKLNSATSLFYISASTTTSAASSSYCTFATLKDDSKSKLTALKEAIADYVEEQKETNEDYQFAPLVYDIPTDVGDPFAVDMEANYSVPLEPIVIEYVKVTKY